MKLGLFVLAAAVLAAGCTPAKIVKMPAAEPAQSAQVFIYRETAFNAGGVTMIFGENKTDHIELNNSQYAEFQAAAGTHDYFVRSNQADQPYVLRVELLAGEKKCLKAYANPANIGKVLLPMAHYMGNTFLLAAGDCLTPEEMTKYFPVQVEYEAKPPAAQP